MPLKSRILNRNEIKKWVIGKVYVDYRIKTSYSIIGLYTATNFITLSALPWVLPGDILKAFRSFELAGINLYLNLYF